MRILSWMPDAWREYQKWLRLDYKTAIKISDLTEESRRDPFGGRGKPEPLKNKYSGYWSRRITKTDRLVYRVTDDDIVVISCMGHYDN